MPIRLLMVIYFSLALTACKISSDKRLPDINSENETVGPEFVTLSGRVNKGIIQYAQVDLFLLDGPSPGTQDPIATAKTDVKGYFSFSVNTEQLSKPAYVRVSPVAGRSTMVCDVVPQCGEVAFGRPVALEDGFRLSAVIPELKDTSILNITLLTHIAARLALGDLPAASTPNEIDVTGMQRFVYDANSRVASRFGVIGELTSLRTVDLTSEAELVSANSRELWYSALGPGILKAANYGDGSRSLTSIVDEFVSQYYTVGINSQGVVSTLLSYEQILGGAQDTIKFLQGHFAEVELSELLTTLSTARGLANSDVNNGYDRGVASKTAMLSDYEKARALAKDIRQLTASINIPKIVSLANVSSLVDANAAAAIDQFGFELSAAQILEGPRSEYLWKSLSKILYVIYDSFTLHYSGEPIPAELEGVGFTHSVVVNSQLGQDLHTYTFSDTFFACSTNVSQCLARPQLTITVAGVNVSGNFADKFLRADSLTLKLAGQIGVDSLLVKFDANEQFIKLVKPTFVDIAGRKASVREDEQHIVFIADQLELSGPINMEYTDPDNERLTLAAELKVTSQGVEVELLSDRQERYVSQEVEVNTFSEIKINSLKQFTAGFNVGVSNAQGDSFIAALGLSQTKVFIGDSIRYRDGGTYICAQYGETDLSRCRVVDEDSGFKDETEDNFLSLAASLGFKANLSGVDAPVLIEISGGRDGPGVNRIDRLKLRYPGSAISLSGGFSTRGKFAYMTRLDAVSLDGVNLSMALNEESDRDGSISSSLGEKIADIIDMGQWLKVVFYNSNGKFESLCGQC